MGAEEEIGTVSQELQDAMAYAANLETVRINRWRMIRIFKQKIGNLDATRQVLDSDTFEPGWIYVINNITAWADDNKADIFEIGFVAQHTFHRLVCEIPADDLVSSSYVGQLVLAEGEKIRIAGRGLTEADTLYLYASGYKIKR